MRKKKGTKRFQKNIPVSSLFPLSHRPICSEAFGPDTDRCFPSKLSIVFLSGLFDRRWRIHPIDSFSSWRSLSWRDKKSTMSTMSTMPTLWAVAKGKKGQSLSLDNQGKLEMKILTVESQDPVQRLIASLLTPRQLTRFSWPFRLPTRSPRRTSQTFRWLEKISTINIWNGWKPDVLTLHSKSSYPAKSNRPETENATEVIPHKIWSL